MNLNLVLFTINGKDHPGITAELMTRITEENVELIDMGQSITHGLLSLSFILKLDLAESKLVEALTEIAHRNHTELHYQIIDTEDEIKKIEDKYILSCVRLDGIKPSFLADISSVLARNNINILRIENITQTTFTALDIMTTAQSQKINWEEIKAELIQLSNLHKTDMALLKDNVWRRNKRLIVFDMDSTLIQSEVIDEMAKVHNVYEEVHNITEKAMNGEFDFDSSLKKRVSLLKGLSEKELINIRSSIKLTDGVEEFIKTVKKLGYKVAIISGGFNYFANYFKETLGLDYAFANELEIQNGILTGNVKGSIINAEKKAMLVELISQQENINLEQVVAIGDGANDLEMLAKAGLGIAFHAKEIVKKTAKQQMSHGPMTSILYFLGIPGSVDL